MSARTDRPSTTGPPAFIDALAQIVQAVTGWHGRPRRRPDLAALNDRMLDDIGLSADVERYSPPRHQDTKS
jgi:uncharacterized protein YjiS (DUF1127 family)